MPFCLFALFFFSLLPGQTPGPVKPSLWLNEKEYFSRPGVDVMAFHDIYPEGHQGGLNIIQAGERVASNGDIRLSATPGQWQPIPKQEKREVLRDSNEIVTTLSYPDLSRHRKGFNPIDYPDLKLRYKVRVRGEGPAIRVLVDFDEPVPAEWIGRVSFNLELYPASLFGKTWYLDSASGIFPRQANGPDRKDPHGDIIPAPLAIGRRLSVAPETSTQHLLIESRTGELQLLDGRNEHNNGWFVVRTPVPEGKTTGAIDWVITPHAPASWKSEPVIHVSQAGYHPAQSKVAVLELDASDTPTPAAKLLRISENGGFETAHSGRPTTWQGSFLRYKYLRFDFSAVQKPGMYVVEYGRHRSQPFQISPAVLDRHVWQPVLEYFLPAQMCHMRIEEQYRVWHGVCHLDDARMAPVDHNHFDGYLQGASTLTKYKPGETVPGLDIGGWHDAGDDDMRIESQADEVHILASAYEMFGVDYDDTTIDQKRKLVRIHQPDGKPDILQQVEHGVLTILAGYRAMGRVYRGIIVPTLQQYVLLGDTANVTDNLFHDAALQQGRKTGTHSAATDDRWVFTEQNAGHEFKAIAALAIAGRVLRQYNPELAKECLDTAEALWKQDRQISRGGFDGQILAAVELWLTTKNSQYGAVLSTSRQQLLARLDSLGWALGRIMPMITDADLASAIRAGISTSHAKTVAAEKENPYGVPYRPHIWGAGWTIQRFGFQQYFLHRGFPEIVGPEYMLNALNFVLGVHPGTNTASFASGVGARSMTIAYGYNRADYSYIPGGVVSGTALIRPDFPEMKDFPYLWQQSEYVLGGGSSNYMFLVLAARDVLAK